MWDREVVSISVVNDNGVAIFDLGKDDIGFAKITQEPIIYKNASLDRDRDWEKKQYQRQKSISYQTR